MCFYFANKTTHTISYLFIFGDIFNYLYYFLKKLYYTIDASIGFG